MTVPLPEPHLNPPDPGDARCIECGANTENPRRTYDHPCPNHDGICMGCCLASDEHYHDGRTPCDDCNDSGYESLYYGDGAA